MPRPSLEGADAETLRLHAYLCSVHNGYCDAPYHTKGDTSYRLLQIAGDRLTFEFRFASDFNITMVHVESFCGGMMFHVRSNYQESWSFHKKDDGKARDWLEMLFPRALTMADDESDHCLWFDDAGVAMLKLMAEHAEPWPAS